MSNPNIILTYSNLYLDEFSQMFTAAKENEFKDEAVEVGLVQDIRVRNYNRKPRYSVKTRNEILDSSADEEARRNWNKL